MNAMRAERMKGRRRMGWLMNAALAGMVLLWCSMGKLNADERQNGYSAYLAMMAVADALVMPVGMAALASRAWDMEYRAGSLKLLFTLQSRESLFGAKAAVGVRQMLLVSALHVLGLAALGRIKGATQAFPTGDALLMGLSVFGVNAMLFFAALWLSIRKESQALTLGAGAVMSMLGIFSAFMPPRLAVLMPWGYYVKLCTITMEYDTHTRVTTFTRVPYDPRFLAVCAVLAAMFAALAWRRFQSREV